MKIKTILFSFLIFTTGYISAQDNEFDNDILKFMEVNGTKQNMEPVLTQMMTQFKTMKTGVPEEFWTQAQAEMVKDLDGLMKKMVPIYKKHFTQEEIKGLIEFYNSPFREKFYLQISENTPRNHANWSTMGHGDRR